MIPASLQQIGICSCFNFFFKDFHEAANRLIACDFRCEGRKLWKQEDRRNHTRRTGKRLIEKIGEDVVGWQGTGYEIVLNMKVDKA